MQKNRLLFHSRFHLLLHSHRSGTWISQPSRHLPHLCSIHYHFVTVATAESVGSISNMKTKRLERVQNTSHTRIVIMGALRGILFLCVTARDIR